MAEKKKKGVSVRGANAASGKGSGPKPTTDATADEGSLLDQIITKGKMSSQVSSRTRKR